MHLYMSLSPSEASSPELRWRKNSKEHQHYENYGKTETARKINKINYRTATMVSC